MRYIAANGRFGWNPDIRCGLRNRLVTSRLLVAVRLDRFGQRVGRVSLPIDFLRAASVVSNARIVVPGIS